MHNYPIAHRYIILTLSLYFGWLLSFPFYGPVLYASAPILEYKGVSIPFIFTLFHAVTFLLAGLLLRYTKIWKRLMIMSLGVTIACVTALPFFHAPLWPLVMALLGVSSAIYTLGWTYPFATYVTIGDRFKLMALVIIGANIINIIFNFISAITSPFFLLILSGLLPWLTLLPLLSLPVDFESKLHMSITGSKQPVFPKQLMLIFSLFITGLYLCGGFMYSIVQPSLISENPLFLYYRYLPYIIALIIMLYFGERLQRYFLIYMGASLIGLSFVSFAIGQQSTALLFLSTTMIEAGFALLDLFIWITLGDLALIYSSPFKTFGFALAAKLCSMLIGDLLGAELVEIGEEYRLFTALFAAAAIFLTYTVIPWFNERMQKDLYRLLSNENKHDEVIEEKSIPDKDIELKVNPLERAINLLTLKQKLTLRETEIVALLLKGMTNKDIAAQLYISVNTLKTHLRNIYSKYGVAQKRELFTLIIDKDTHIHHDHY